MTSSWSIFIQYLFLLAGSVPAHRSTEPPVECEPAAPCCRYNESGIKLTTYLHTREYYVRKHCDVDTTPSIVNIVKSKWLRCVFCSQNVRADKYLKDFGGETQTAACGRCE